MEPNFRSLQPPTMPPPAGTTTAPTAATDRQSRRRGSREVNSRYLASPSPAVPRSPSPVSSSSDPHLPASPRFPTHHHHPFLPLPKRPHHHRRPLPVPSSPASDSESDTSSSFADENQPQIAQRKHVVRLFNNNAGDRHHQPPRKTRPNTPIVSVAAPPNTTPRMSSSNPLRSVNVGTTTANRIPAPHDGRSDLASLARANPFVKKEDGRVGSRESSPENGGFCHSPPLNNGRARSVSEMRSSMPEGDLVPTRRSVDGGSASSSMCYRSLSSALSNCQKPPFNPSNSMNKPPTWPKVHSGTPKTVGFCPQPQSQNAVLGKGKKALDRHEDVHSLRMLHNNDLQWRFVNAKARAAVHARTITAENSLYEASAQISELRNSVSEKQIKLEKLKREGNLSAIIEAQMPSLQEWAIVEGDYASSLSGTTKALQDASLRLPVIGNVKADVRELTEALNCAVDLLEALSPCVGRFLPHAEGVEDVITDLHSVVNRENDLIEECGNLLAAVQMLQVKECSLRSQAMQIKRNM